MLVPGEITVPKNKFCHICSGIPIALVEEVDQHNTFDAPE